MEEKPKVPGAALTPTCNRGAVARNWARRATAGHVKLSIEVQLPCAMTT